MTNEKAFLVVIIDKPDDDSLRLLFADWFDEHGQSDRAEFIRLQVRMAQRPDAPEWPDLSGRAKNLLRAHAKEWGPTSPGAVGTPATTADCSPPSRERHLARCASTVRAYVGVAEVLAAGTFGPRFPQSTPAGHAGAPRPAPVTHR